jgi:hypothetical protein
MLKDYTHYDYEDVIGIVIDITKSVFRYAESQLGRQIRDELETADHAATCIQTKWRESISNPTYDVCKRRLEREFNSLQEV